MSTSVSCMSVNLTNSCTPSGGDAVIGGRTMPPIETPFTEDCLFLDIYVPSQALESSSLVPVIVWFYGGAFVFGSKSEFDPIAFPFYTGVGPITSAKEPIIFVAGNYRLGAYGWLAGSHTESDGLPNAALYDQRKILQFVHDHISLLQGDPTAVSAWGESAGAASILHHLVANDGQTDPLFSKAILQSPAYQWQWNRNGTLDQTYMKFATLAGCPDGNMQCLQNATDAELTKANQQIFHDEILCNGIFPLGPSLDNGLIQTLPAVAFAQGKFCSTGSQSLIVSHVQDEIAVNSSFIPYPFRQYPNETTFENFLYDFMPGMCSATEPQIARVAALIGDSSFVCNTRQLFGAYSKVGIDVYMMSYSFLSQHNSSVHGSDLLPTFYTRSMDLKFLIPNWAIRVLVRPSMLNYSTAYQSYLTSHALYGNPNKGARHGAAKVNWPLATNDESGP
ncbi:hypothetical protein MMC25_006237 [Agyrium rufum]|nr:hypothetical protein [Agyrium rufum]